MKNTLLFAALALLCQSGMAAPTQVSMQSAKSGSTSAIAPSLGFTSFALKTEGFDVGAQSGLSLGANYYHSLGIDNLDLEVGLHYLQTGGKQVGYEPTTLMYLENSLSFSYIALPIGARYKFYKFGAQAENTIYAKGGVAPSFLMSAKQKISALGLSEERDLKNEVNTFDLMGYIGLGGTYHMGSDQEILYELSYMQGTQQVLKQTDSVNEGAVISLMYSIGI
ncbi:MAG: outer membrane beta-barrel protein [Pseudobdellovibrionaceae bacterium]